MSGILGVFSFEDHEAFVDIYYGLFALQHRGQGSVGVGTLADSEIYLHKFKGLVSDHFGENLITDMPGNKGIGFVEYEFATEQLSSMPIRSEDGLMAIDGFITTEDFDPQEMMKVLGQDIQTIKQYFSGIEGKYALIYMNNERFIAYKNVDGIKPLSIGRAGKTTIASSETSAIESVGVTIVREVQPGEMFMQTQDEAVSYYLSNNMEVTENIDAFEFIYTARPDSVLDGISVYEARYRLGETLWHEDKLQNGIVVGAPDSGLIPALGYANASGLMFQMGFVRNRYIGRTFIKATQLERERGVQIKLTPIKATVAHRDIILIDDSIVRGTTMTRTVQNLKAAGAKSVHVRVASPPIIHDESITVDIPDKDDLIAYNRSLDEIQSIIGCDSLKYISHDGFHRSIGRYKLYEPYFQD